MYRFMPTASGQLHIGHFGVLCLIEHLAGNCKKYFVIDDHQLANWGMYEKDYTQEEIDNNILSIRAVMDFYFPSFENAGNFLDQKFELARSIEYCRQAHNVEQFNWHDKRYAILKKDLRYISTVKKDHYLGFNTKTQVFDVLKTFYKHDSKTILTGYREWNPFFSHEVVDKVLKSKFQIVDWSLYCPYSYLYDDHTNSYELFSYWGEIINKQDMKILLHAKITDHEGNALKKSQINEDNPYILMHKPFTDISLQMSRIQGAYGIKQGTSLNETKLLIAQKLYEANVQEPFKLKKI